jgi:hypothetical protein
MSKPNRPLGTATPAATHQNVALAVARQRLGDAHFQFILEMIRRGQGEVAAPQVLLIYARLHYLPEIDLQSLRNRVLVYLGQVANTDVTHLPNTFVAIDGDVEWDVTASMVERIRRRLNGRNNYVFREWVELHTGHVYSKLLRIHIDNLVPLHEASQGELKPAETTRLYVREMNLREGMFEPLYHGLLERIYEAVQIEDELESEPGAEPATAGATEPDESREPKPGVNAAYARLKEA